MIQRNIPFADRGKAMVGHYKHIGIAIEPLESQEVQNLSQIVIGITYSGVRRRSIDARKQMVNAVTLIMLRTIRITRPVDQQKRLCFTLCRSQRRLRGDVCKIDRKSTRL